VRRALVLFVVLAALAACIPESRHPLSPVEQARADTRLAGLWSGRLIESELDVLVQFVPRGSGMTDILLIADVSPDNTADAGWSAYRMFPSRLGGRDFMNIRLLSNDGKPAGEEGENYLLCRYRFEADGRLGVWRLSQEAAKSAVENGKLAGEIREGLTTDVVLTAPGADLADFFAGDAGESYFATPVGSFTRVR